MARHIHIHLNGSGPNRRTGRSGRGHGLSDPGEDLTLPPISDPGEDLTLPPISDPGEDLTLPPISDPDRLADALADSLAERLGGDLGAPAIVVHADGGCQCCNAEEAPPTDKTAPLGVPIDPEHSGFVIVRLRPGFPPRKDRDWSLLQLADTYAPALEDLRQALSIPAPSAGQNLLPQDPPATFLGSWPLLAACAREKVSVEADGIPEKRRSVADCRPRIRELETRVAGSPFAPRHSLTSYWRIDGRALGEAVTDLVDRLNALGSVDLAYRELQASDPGEAGVSFDEDLGFLDEAPFGIGAACIPALVASTAIKCVDLEQAWHALHLNLGLQEHELYGGANRNEDEADQGHHGAAVLGTWVGQKATEKSSTVQVQGILPQATRCLASHYFGSKAPDLSHLPDHEAPEAGGPLSRTNGHVANAIAATLDALIPDDWPNVKRPPAVLLLEVQRSLLPTEVDPADFDAIRLATALGIIVVEAAGNGGVNLDEVMDSRGVRVFDRSAAGFRDSGAILTGAAWSALPHNRAYFSNFGSRVDCYAWGDRVTTCGYGDLAGANFDTFDDLYTCTFAGTSSAAPIIAGAAGLLLGLVQEATGLCLEPARLRGLLADRATGTPQGPDVGGAVGVMPNLKAILDRSVCVGPKVYLRKNPWDDGAGLPPTDLTSSPDILIDHQPPATPQTRFGESSAFAQLPAVGFPADTAKQKYLYLRFRNAGAAPASVHCDLYGGRPATLMTPSRWRLLTSSGAVSATVPPGDQLTVSSPLPWMPGDHHLSLKNGESCALLAVERAGDPASSAPETLPPSGKYFRLGHLLSFYRRRTVSVRNVHVVPPDWPPAFPLTFDITGTPDRPRRYDFELRLRLPAGVSVKLEVPDALALKLSKATPFLQAFSPMPGSTSTDTAQLALPPMPCLEIKGVALAAAACCPAKLHVDDLNNKLTQGHSITLRQLYRGLEIGRITWRFKK